MVPNFFVSSAAGDDDQYVRQLFDDLRDRVSQSSSDHGAELSFLGTVGNRDAAPPPEMLLRLASCDVFVALTSPRYFRNAACGRQWEIFADRYPPGAPKTAMIPVLWAAGGNLPSLVGEAMTPPGDDVHRGLRQLIRLRSLRPGYEAFVDELAARIVEIGQSVPAPAGEPVSDFSMVDNAFALSTSDARVHLVVAAATRDEMDKVRSDLAYYGSEPLDWAPFIPSAPESIASRARLLAADQAMHAEVAALDDVLDRIERARAANEIVVILCDWWLTQLESYQRILAEIDRRGLGDTAVLVPANRTDTESMGNLAELRYGLRSTFRRTAETNGSLLRSDIDTPDAFDVDLAGVLAEARNRLFRSGESRLAVTDQPIAERPILRGPR
jgi:FxsC-like protein